jgi:cilia- and flagella-associated protein 57
MISRRFVFGVRQDVKDGLHYMDDSTCVWAAGKSIVVYNTQLGTQKFVACTESCEAITAMAVSSNRRNLAVAESGDSPCICIYAYDPQGGSTKFRRKRVLQVPGDIGSREYVCLCFSLDGRYLVSQGGFPDWSVVYWNVEKSKALVTTSVVDKGASSQDRRLISQCSISPKDQNLVCVSGNGIFKFFRFSEGQLKPAPGGMKGDPMNYLAHLWLPPEDRMIVSTDNGDLLLIENGEYKYPLPLSPSDGLSIDALIAHSKGFVCGGDMGLVTIFERSEDKELYRKMRTLKVEAERRDADGLASNEESAKVLAFSLTPPPSEEYLGLLTSNKQLYTLNLSNADFTKADERVCEAVCQPFHAGPVTGLDVCIRKPLIATCGKDRKIMLWNYQTNAVECAKTFATEILSVAIHPSGLHLLVGFPDKLRFMNLYGDDIREFKNFGIRSCSECRFSTGGQYFAAMHSTIIHVYFTYTCELIGHLRGHNGKVKNIQFVAPDDTRLVSVGNDGAVHEFSLTDFHKVNDHVIKAITYNAVAADVNTIWAAGNDRKLRQFERAHLQQQMEYDMNNAALQCLAISTRMKLLIGGCEDGSVRVFNTFMGEKAVQDKDAAKERLDITIENHTAHTGAVTRIALTFDESLIATVGDDGIMTLWDVVAPHRPPKKDFEFTHEILIDKRDLEDRTKAIMDLQAQVQELKQRMEHQQIKRERKHEEQMSKLEEEFKEEKARQMSQLDKLLADKNEQAIKFTEHRSEMEDRHRLDLTKIDQDYTAKILALKEQETKLKAAIDEQRSDFETEMRARQDAAGDAAMRESDEHRRQLQGLDDNYSGLLDKKGSEEERASELQKLIESETDVEIIGLKENYEKRRKEQEEEMAALQATNSSQLSKENLSKADLDAKKADIAEKLKQQASLDMQIEGFKRDIDALNNELKERSETILDKDKRIYDLKKKNQELEKFKFVLDYKIRELKSQIDPRDEEIRQARSKYGEMEGEAERYLHNNEALVLQIRGLKLKIDGQVKELENLSGKLQTADEFQSRLWTELSDLHDEKNPRRLKDMVKVLYAKHTSTSTTVAPPGATKSLGSRTPEDAQREYNRERDYLERTVSGLKRKLVKDSETNRSDRTRIIGENVVLIKEINELRREVKTLNASRKNLDVTALAASAEQESKRELDIQRAEMVRLRGRIDQLERQLHAVGRPVSIATPALM